MNIYTEGDKIKIADSNEYGEVRWVAGRVISVNHTAQTMNIQYSRSKVVATVPMSSIGVRPAPAARTKR